MRPRISAPRRSIRVLAKNGLTATAIRNGASVAAMGQATMASALSSPTGMRNATIIGEMAWAKKYSTVSTSPSDHADEVARATPDHVCRRQRLELFVEVNSHSRQQPEGHVVGLPVLQVEQERR